MTDVHRRALVGVRLSPSQPVVKLPRCTVAGEALRGQGATPALPPRVSQRVVMRAAKTGSI